MLTVIISRWSFKNNTFHGCPSVICIRIVFGICESKYCHPAVFFEKLANLLIPYRDFYCTKLNSKNLADGGPLPTSTKDMLIDASTYNASTLPGAKRGDDGSMLLKGVEVRTRQIVFASTGREWGVVSEEGLHIYSLDDDMIFDPISMLEQEIITPATIEHKLSSREYSIALRMALYLNEYHIIQNVLDQIPYGSIEFVCRSIHHDTNASQHKKKNSTLHHQPLEILLQVISTMIDESPHLEFYIHWSLVLLQLNGFMIECNRSIYLRVLRALHKAIVTKLTDFYAICNDNKYMLEFIENHASLMKQIKQDERQQNEEMNIPTEPNVA
jgi:periodic tryptophan protein 2